MDKISCSRGQSGKGVTHSGTYSEGSCLVHAGYQCCSHCLGDLDVILGNLSAYVREGHCCAGPGNRVRRCWTGLFDTFYYRGWNLTSATQIDNPEFVNGVVRKTCDGCSVGCCTDRREYSPGPTNRFYSIFNTDEPVVIEEPLSAMNGTLRRMWKVIDRPECLELVAPVDVSSKKYFYNANYIIKCPLTNLLNYPIGTITVGFSASGPADAVSKTSAISKRVTGYLNASF